MTRTENFRITLLDNHAIVRYGLTKRFEEDGCFKVVGSYDDSYSLLEGLRNFQTDALLIDYILGPTQIDGITLIRTIRNRFPEIKLIVLSTLYDKSFAQLAKRAGAHAFLGKDLSLTELVKQVRSIILNNQKNNENRYKTLSMINNNQIFTQNIKRNNNNSLKYSPLTKIVNNDYTAINCNSTYGCCPALQRIDNAVIEQRKLLYECLTPREIEVLRCFFEGLTVSKIGTKFRRSPKTISAQKASAYRKLGIESDREFFKVWSISYCNNFITSPAINIEKQ